MMPQDVEGIPNSVLDPRQGWADAAAYDRAAAGLVGAVRGELFPVSRGGFRGCSGGGGSGDLMVRAVALALAIVVAAAGVSEARRRGGERFEGGQGAGFDYFLLSLSVAPSFCSLSDRNAAKAECRELTGEAYRATPLTIHGLWPNRAFVGARGQPQDCDGPEYAVSDGVAAALAPFMPGGPGLARYEWRKHGTCSGMGPDAYFGAEVRLARRANEVIGAAILAQGGRVQIGALLDAVGRVDAGLAAAIVVDCRFPRGGGDAVVEEIRVTLSKELVPIAAGSVGLGQNSGCPGGVGVVPGVR